MTAKHINCLIVFVPTLLGRVSQCVELQVTQRGGGSSAPFTFSAWLTWLSGKDNETLSQFNHSLGTDQHQNPEFTCFSLWFCLLWLDSRRQNKNQCILELVEIHLKQESDSRKHKNPTNGKYVKQILNKRDHEILPVGCNSAMQGGGWESPGV